MTLSKLQDLTRLEVDPQQLEQVLQVISTMKTDNLEDELIETEEEQTQITADDYEEIKNMWIRYYREAPIPIDQGFNSRAEWVRSELRTLMDVTRLLNSSNKDEQKQGLSKYDYLVPLMLYGGFNYPDTVKYLIARKDAAEFVAKEQELGGGGETFQGQEQVLVDKVENVHVSNAQLQTKPPDQEK